MRRVVLYLIARFHQARYIRALGSYLAAPVVNEPDRRRLLRLKRRAEVSFGKLGLKP